MDEKQGTCGESKFCITQGKITIGDEQYSLVNKC
jgi:hypothetical protein